MNKKIFAFLFGLSLVACVQEEVDIVYKENNNSIAGGDTIKKDMFQPSYMRGTYVKTANNKIVRDLRKNDVEVVEEKDTENTNDVEELSSNKKETVKNKKTTFVRVKSGDSLSTIGASYNMSLNEIATLNNIKSPYNIYVGQRLKVFSDGDETKGEVKYKTITVESGDNLIKIASQNKSTVREIATINDIKPPYKVYTGQKLKVPANDSAESASVDGKTSGTAVYKYTVKSGDNLYSISKQVGVSVSDLIKYNNLQKPYRIYVGQKLNTKNTSGAQDKAKKTSVNAEPTKQNEEVKQTSTDKINKEEIKNVDKADKQSTNLLKWPVKGDVIKRFGKQENGEYNDAISIKAQKGDNIVAAENGEVAYTGNELKNYGNIIIVKHSNGILSIYGHCDTINVKVKDKVTKGQVIGTVGQTGTVSEPQLYFAVRKGRVAMDPLKYLEK